MTTTAIRSRLNRFNYHSPAFIFDFVDLIRRRNENEHNGRTNNQIFYALFHKKSFIYQNHIR